MCPLPGRDTLTVGGSRALARLRKLCLSLAGAYEEETWGQATFRVQRKIFAVTSTHGERTTVSLKAEPGEQQALLAVGDPYYFPPYLGHKGWIGVDLRSGLVDWDEVAELLTDSYRLVAPKRLSARLE
jgi:predicted DNA-binding protein (MmcQ/YjbR family)